MFTIDSSIIFRILDFEPGSWTDRRSDTSKEHYRCEENLEPKAALEPTAVVRNFLHKLLAREGESQPFADSDSLLLSGRLQSVDGVEIVVFLEEKFGLDFAELGFDLAKIDSVNSIVALIDAKQH